MGMEGYTIYPLGWLRRVSFSGWVMVTTIVMPAANHISVADVAMAAQEDNTCAVCLVMKCVGG